MALTVDDGREKEPMYTSDKRLYLTPDGEVSEEPVSGGRLLVPAGGEMSNEAAERLGLVRKQEQPKSNKGRKDLEDKA